MSSVLAEQEIVFIFSIDSKGWVYTSSIMLYTSYLVEVESDIYWGIISWANLNTLWQHKCNKYFKESCYAFENKPYSNQVSLLKTTHSRIECQVGMYFLQRIDLVIFHKKPSQRDIWVSQTKFGGNIQLI